MAQRERGLHRLLGASRIYQGVQDLLGARRFQRRFVADWLGLRPGHRLLDIGCGPAAILEHVPAGVEYHGFDDSADYLAAARARFGHRGTFWQARVERATLDRLGGFDRVIAIGVLHHLDDDAAAALLDLAAAALAPGGALVTYDPCFAPGQPRLARFLAERDRGQNVRTPDAYAALAGARFAAVTPEVVSGHLRVPYTATVMTCREPRLVPAGAAY
jgi:SAM-dependent methyltransferase